MYIFRPSMVAFFTVKPVLSLSFAFSAILCHLLGRSSPRNTSSYFTKCRHRCLHHFHANVTFATIYEKSYTEMHVKTNKNLSNGRYNKNGMEHLCSILRKVEDYHFNAALELFCSLCLTSLLQVDAGHIYGDNLARQLHLRLHKDGKLKYQVKEKQESGL